MHGHDVRLLLTGINWDNGMDSYLRPHFSERCHHISTPNVNGALAKPLLISWNGWDQNHLIQKMVVNIPTYEANIIVSYRGYLSSVTVTLVSKFLWKIDTSQLSI